MIIFNINKINDILNIIIKLITIKSLKYFIKININEIIGLFLKIMNGNIDDVFDIIIKIINQIIDILDIIIFNIYLM